MRVSRDEMVRIGQTNALHCGANLPMYAHASQSPMLIYTYIAEKPSGLAGATPVRLN